MWEISIIGISQIIFGIILILSKKKERTDYILILWLCTLSLPFIQTIQETLNPTIDYSSTVLNQAFTILHGPFLYIYIKELIKRRNEKIKYWPHLIIFIIFYIIFIINPAPIHPGGPNDSIITSFSISKYFGLINIIVFITYGILSILTIYNHREKVKNTFAYTNNKINLIWLNLLPIIFIIMISIILIIENSNLENIIEIEALHQIMFLFLALYLIFFGLKQNTVFPNEKEEQNQQKVENKTTVNKIEPIHKNNENDRLLKEMDALMKEDKLYLNPTLSVYDLSDSLNVSRHQISSLLNNDLSMNFYHYVNKYRLEEFCNRLKEDTNNQYNILDHAFDSGFNSKSSFNSLFKSNYQQTPSQYRKSLKTLSS
ncbi:MAG: helix-turn-helix domain-containing protein [Pleomorphochaeta sp.]